MNEKEKALNAVVDELCEIMAIHINKNLENKEISFGDLIINTIANFSAKTVMALCKLEAAKNKLYLRDLIYKELVEATLHALKYNEKLLLEKNNE